MNYRDGICRKKNWQYIWIFQIISFTQFPKSTETIFLFDIWHISIDQIVLGFFYRFGEPMK